MTALNDALHTNIVLRHLKRLLAARLADRGIGERLAYLLRAMRTARLIAASGLFDPKWYANTGRAPPAPRGPFGTPILHYVLRGAAEGRSPSAGFDGDWYLRRYPEVGWAAMNPLAHYIVHGREAGYATRPAAPFTLPRQQVSPESYAAWKAEMVRLHPPPLAPEPETAPSEPPFAICTPTMPDTGKTAFVLLVPHGIHIAANAVPEFCRARSRSPHADLIFADEEYGGPDTPRPWFKPGFDPEIFRAADLTGPATLLRRALLPPDWNGQPPDAAALRALAQRAIAKGAQPHHIPKILFRRPAAPHFAAPRLALPAEPPLVSVIVPTRDRAELLQKAVEGVLAATDYPQLELLIVDNGSVQPATHALFARTLKTGRARILSAPGPFNWSALNNVAARQARGDVLVLLNNDVEIIAPDWLRELVVQVLRPEIGIAGARLLYPDRTIQHAGLSIDTNGCFVHVFRGAPADHPGLLGEITVPRSVAAVTGACLAIRRDLFRQVGGLEENRLAVTSNDIDLCLRVRAAGHRVIETPLSVLVHREAATRGHDGNAPQLARVLAERRYLLERWGDLARRDPFQNPNLCLLRERPALEAPSILAGKAIG